MKHALGTASLIIGAPEKASEFAFFLIQKSLCIETSCTGTCTICRMIRTVIHPSMLWITPIKKYTLEQLEPLFNTISFTLEANQQFFFILDKADLLTAACANSLLKMVEEPPAGYHFIFLAQQPQLVLPTIRSRCHLYYAQPTETATPSGFLRHFISSHTCPTTFLKELSDAPEDHEVLQCLDVLLFFWTQQYAKTIDEASSTTHLHAQHMIELLKEAMEHPPMPGSAKLFWRNLLLRKERIFHETS